jgi:uncharacterized membrane protein YphA (DoxX/SURF4 family)
MAIDHFNNRQLGATEHNMARVLIAFYFIAVAAGFAEGVSLEPLFGTFMSDSLAHIASAIVLFAMGFLVLIGGILRGVALMTAGLLMASYVLTAAKTGDWQVPSTIWRDIALVGALVLTYAQGAVRSVPVKRKPVTRVERGGLSKSEEEALLAQVPGRGIEPKKSIPPRHQRPVLEEVFRCQGTAS